MARSSAEEGRRLSSLKFVSGLADKDHGVLPSRSSSLKNKVYGKDSSMVFSGSRKGRTMVLPTHKERWVPGEGRHGYIHTHSMSSIKTLALVRYVSFFVSLSSAFSFYCTLSAKVALCLVDFIDLVMSEMDSFHVIDVSPVSAA